MTFWMSVLGSFIGSSIGCIVGIMVADRIWAWRMARRISQAEKYIETLQKCDMLMQDIESSIHAINMQGGQ